MNQACAGMIVAGVHTGIVISSGHQVTHVVPIHEGKEHADFDPLTFSFKI